MSFSAVRIEDLITKAAPHLTGPAQANLEVWLREEPFSAFRTEIASMIDGGEWDDLRDSFYTHIPFGTGGRRGKRGVGPNRINDRTIAESAAGLLNWARTKPAACAGGVAIAHDTRHGSVQYTRVCARVIAAAGIPVYLFDSHRPTPELSYAVRRLHCDAGIVISASHNPPSDNGFKAYGRDGGQLVPPDDQAVLDQVDHVGNDAIPMVDFDDAVSDGRITIVGREIDQPFIDAICALSVAPHRRVRVVYSPLHGVGGRSVLPVLAQAGFADVHVVEGQSEPDGDFPNVPNHIPNPEVITAMEMARDLAIEVDADIAIATDPDADRLGCVAKRMCGGRAEWLPLNGNEIGAIICEYVVRSLHERGRLRSDALVARTTVTTRVIDHIANRYGVGLINDLLVGFKYIACILNNIDDPTRLVFGAEESHGYLGGEYTRDKDAAGAALLLSEAAASTKEQGGDLWTLLEQIHRAYGYHRELLENIVLEGEEGKSKIDALLASLRANPPTEFADLPVLEMIDRQNDTVLTIATGRSIPVDPTRDPKTSEPIEALQVASDNLLIFRLGANDSVAGGQVAVRPSGTEPKCKLYVAVSQPVHPSAEAAEYDALSARVDAFAQRVMSAALSRASDILG